MMRFISQMVVTIVGDGTHTDIGVDTRDLGDIPGFKPGTQPDNIVSVTGATAVLNGHVITFTITPALAGGQTRNVTVNFGVNGR